jgi:HEAT repeat protein
MDDLQSLLTELTGGDDTRAEAVIPHLVSCGKPAMEALRDLLGNPDSDKRWWATRALSEFQEPEISTPLIEMLSDPDVEVRQCAALGLYSHPDERAVPALITALSSGDHILLHLAGNTLIAIGEPAVLPLIEAVKNADQAARLEAVRALALIADPRAAPVLMEVCKENSVMMEYWANEGFERMGMGMVYLQP